VCVLAADGLMLEKAVLKKTLGEDHIRILTEFQDLIVRKLGFNLVFTIKDMDKGYNAILDEHVHPTRIFNIKVFHNITEGLKYKEDRVKLDELTTEYNRKKSIGVTDEKLAKKIISAEKDLLEAKDNFIFGRRKRYFESFHAKMMKGVYFIRKGQDTIEILCRDKLNAAYENLDNGHFIPRWLKNQFTLTYEKCDFLPYPLKCDPKYVYNLYEGLKGEEYIFDYKGDLSPHFLYEKSIIFIKHLWYIIGKNNEHLEYMLSYLADIVQNPGAIRAVAIVIKSE
jgi:hypothetical protein